MSFGEYLNELGGKTKILAIAALFLAIPFLAFIIDVEANYNNPSLKWLAKILGYSAVPSLILFLVFIGYYKWKYNRK